MTPKKRTEPDPTPIVLSDEPRSLLLLDPCSTEEAVLSTPAYSAVGSRFREAKRALVTAEENARLLCGDPNFHEVIGIRTGFQVRDWLNARSLRLIFTLRRSRYDAAIDLTDGARMAPVASLLGIPIRIGLAGAASSRHLTHAVSLDPVPADPLKRKLALLERLGCPSRRRRPVLFPAPGDERYVRDLVRGTGLEARGRFLVIAPTPNWPAILPPRALAGVADAIGAEHPSLAVFFAGHHGLKDYINETVSLCGRRPSVLHLSPNHFAAFASISDLVIGGEGLPSLLASAVGAHVIGVFASTHGSDPQDDLPIDATSLLALVRGGLAGNAPTVRRTEKRRYYEQEDFRRTRGEANLFLHTAP